MKFLKCPVCKSLVPPYSEQCPICNTQFTKFQYFRMNHLKKTILVILILLLIYNTIVIMIENRKIRNYLQNPPETMEEILELEENYNKLNFFQKYFVHESEINLLKENFENRAEEKNVLNDTATVYFDDGSKTGDYSGKTVNDVPHGIGKFDFTTSNGTNCTYEGEFEEGNITGYGTLTFSNGYKYVGNFRNGNLNGYATKYNPDGYIIEQGEFINNQLYGEGALYDDNQNVIYEGAFQQGIPQNRDYYAFCSEVNYSDISNDIQAYINANVKISGTVSDIITNEDRTKQYIITPDGAETNSICIQHKGKAINIAVGNSITVYGYFTGKKVFHDSLQKAYNDLNINSFYITRN